VSPQAGKSAHQPGGTVAEVLRVGLPDYAAEHPLPTHHWRVFRAIMACRTPQLGGHLYQCEKCDTEKFVPHSCRNRHCPTCQGANGRAWMEQQVELLLPIPYFHLVFTLPHALNPLIRQKQAACYDLLFDSASATLLEFGRHELGAQLGLTVVLHTWSQTLLDHYHVHCIVTGGGLRPDGTWAGTPAHWLFPVQALSAMFRGKFKAGLQQLHQDGGLEFHGDLRSLMQPGAFDTLVRTATREKWVVYAKRPFAGPEPVLAYLARYTHRVGITNQRIREVDAAAKTVTFAYKDYADGAKPKEMTIACTEFVRRLRLHILPERFVKIRHYGILSNRNRRTRLAQARLVLPPMPVLELPTTEVRDAAAQTAGLPTRCPHCHHAGWVLVKVLPPEHPPRARAPPRCDLP
jgi:hypothetical protein